MLRKARVWICSDEEFKDVRKMMEYNCGRLEEKTADEGIMGDMVTLIEDMEIECVVKAGRRQSCF